MTDEEKEGKVDKAPRRGNTSTANERKRAERKRQAKATLEELANLMDAAQGRGDAPAESLADIVRRDAEAMAETIANMAARFTPAAFLVDKVFGAGGPLSMLVSFGPFLRRLWLQAQEIRAERAEAWEAEQAGQVDPTTLPVWENVPPAA